MPAKVNGAGGGAYDEGLPDVLFFNHW